MPPRQRGARKARSPKNADTEYGAPPWMQGQAVPAAAPPVPMPTPAPTAGAQRAPYPLYLPTITRAGEGAPRPPQAGQGAEPQYFDPRRYPITLARLYGRGGAADIYARTPEDLAGGGRQYPAPVTGPAPPAAAAAAEPGGGGGGWGAGTRAAPPGVNPGWYDQFQREHGGQTPEEFYGQTGEGLPEALADKEWSEGFAQMYGRPPTEDDWRAHWFSTRVGYTPEEREAWKREKRAKDEEEERPPLYIPPEIIWR